MSMKTACILLTAIVVVAIMAVCVMVRFATEMPVGERKREYFPDPGFPHVAKSIAMLALNDNNSVATSERFPYVAAIARNASTRWTFACFASVVLVKWVVTAAHCRHKGATHRVLLMHDFANNISGSYPILYWRVHDKYSVNNTSPVYDIAVAKFDIQTPLRSAILDERPAVDVDACIWKTVAAMDKRVYLINDFDRFPLKLATGSRCYESFGVQVDDSLLCVDLTDYEDCFVHEFGPVFGGDRLVGVLALHPRDCEVKLAVFTNVSYYATWVLKLTHATL